MLTDRTVLAKQLSNPNKGNVAGISIPFFVSKVIRKKKNDYGFGSTQSKSYPLPHARQKLRKNVAILTLCATTTDQGPFTTYL